VTRRDPFNEGAQAASARRRRSLAISLLLVAFVALVFSVTVVRLTQNRADVQAEGAFPAQPR